MSKTFRIEPVPNSALVRIAFEGGGEVPDELKGAFTTPKIAQDAIRIWQLANPDRTQEPARVVAREDEKPRPKPKHMDHV